jgi:sulfur-oxidizing protein SoxY
MTLSRRQFLQNSFTLSALLAALPHTVLADWSKAAFEAKTIEDALMALLGSPDTITSQAIEIKVPDVAENGAVVPIQVRADLPNVESITIIAEKNPVPLIAQFKFRDQAVQPFVATRIKMGETSHVMVVVKSEAKLYAARKQVTVTTGGCG